MLGTVLGQSVHLNYKPSVLTLTRQVSYLFLIWTDTITNILSPAKTNASQSWDRERFWELIVSEGLLNEIWWILYWLVLKYYIKTLLPEYTFKFALQVVLPSKEEIPQWCCPSMILFAVSLKLLAEFIRNKALILGVSKKTRERWKVIIICRWHFVFWVLKHLKDVSELSGYT